MAATMALSLSDVNLTLPGPDGDVSILHNINLEVKSRETISIVGASGSGKTSLMMVIAGVESASSGDIIVEGTNISTMDEDQLAAFRQKHIGVVFQNFHLIPTMSALENVAVGLEFAGDKHAQQHAAEALEAIGLQKRLHHYPSQLSGGEQQRVALARATVMRPSLLLADEPTGNLDSETSGRIMDLLFDLQKQHGTTLVLITHDANLANRTNRQLIMQDGQLHEAAYD
ncbi:MAG: ABC transporter ATP-binding protein [Alphaproteobacteria bacterium]|nr:ABC transporter ATP-binding protein [Alphaproteobacteria bacterium]